ncbi:MAG: hypothetical protein KatS3mg105_3602 [Gemmatales bacterium]|nr:MAG: hypothetical protein KatS3mg105_3602 [Gemmatales bacterium]
MIFKSALKSVGDYDLLQQIAEGGMGTVYRGRHKTTGQVVAIKIVPQHLANNQTLIKRFENEFRAASKLNHPNVVRALDYGLVAGRPYLVMEFVEGESVGQKLEREGKMPEAEAIRVIALAARGLEEAHRHGLIHRDVKPDNIMVTPNGEVKLADLGLVKETQADLNLTHTGRGLGTPHFMAPEQFRNAKGADVRCDIYSLGATLYMMVSGELPFKSLSPLDAWMKKMNNDLTPIRKLVPNISESTERVIQRSMDKEPANRHRSCAEFIAELTGEQVSPPPTAPPAVTQPSNDIWYLVYKDEFGTTHSVKGPTAAIRESLAKGLLGDAANIRICRTKTGRFTPLRSHPEFRDVLGDESTATVPRAAATTTRGWTPSHSRSPSSPPNVAPPPDSEMSELTKTAILALVAMVFGMLLYYVFF